MKYTWMYATLSATFLLSVGCKDDKSTNNSQTTESEKTKEASKDEPSSDGVGGLFQRGTSLGKRALNSGSETAKSAVGTVTETLESGNDSVKSAVGTVAETLKSGNDSVKSAVGTVAETLESGKSAVGTVTETLENGKSAVGTPLASGNESMKSAFDSASNIFGDGRSWSEQSLSELKTASENLVKASGDTTDFARDSVNSVVGKIASAADVANRDKIERIMVLMLPVVGPSRRYLDARRLYAEGIEASDSAKISQARRETLLACAEMGLDIGTLGLLGGGIDQLSTGAEKVLVMLKVGRTLNTLTGSDNDILTGYLDSMLEEEHIRNAVDMGLHVGS